MELRRPDWLSNAMFYAVRTRFGSQTLCFMWCANALAVAAQEQPAVGAAAATANKNRDIRVFDEAVNLATASDVIYGWYGLKHLLLVARPA